MSDSTACQAVRLGLDDTTLVITSAGIDPPSDTDFRPFATKVEVVVDASVQPRLSLSRVDGRVRVSLREQSRYVLTVQSVGGSPSGVVAGDQRLTTVHRDVSSTTFMLDTGNSVGWLRIVAEWPAPRPTSVLADAWVAPRKLSSDADFEWLIDDLARSARSLAFNLRGMTDLPWQRSATGESNAYEDLLFLRTIISDVEGALRRVDRHPHERLRRRTPWVDVSIGGEIDELEVVRIGGMPEALAVDAGGRASSWLARDVADRFGAGGHRLVPIQVPVIERFRDRDTYENRFVRFVLEAMSARASDIARRARRSDEPVIAAEATGLAARCRRMLRLPFLDGVGALTGVRGSSQVLMREPSYQLVYRLYLDLLLTAEVEWDAAELRRIQEVRDIATLYEMWVFIQAVQSVLRLTDGEVKTEPGVTPAIEVDDSGLVVRLRQGHASGLAVAHRGGTTTVYYNRSYSPASGKTWRSWSLPLRPDVSIVHDDDRGEMVVALDAKYRIDSVGGVFEENDEDADGTGSNAVTTFRREDVYKMHTYRDALPAVHTAMAVYPGTGSEATLYGVTGDELPGGVGAIPLAPGVDHDTSALDRALHAALTIGGV